MNVISIDYTGASMNNMDGIHGDCQSMLSLSDHSEFNDFDTRQKIIGNTLNSGESAWIWRWQIIHLVYDLMMWLFAM